MNSRTSRAPIAVWALAMLVVAAGLGAAACARSEASELVVTYYYLPG